MFVWGAGIPITGEGELPRAGTWARFEATSVPAYLSKSGNIPARYYSLGIVGLSYTGYRDAGVRVTYERQEFTRFDSVSDSIYWVLSNGVSGLLYQGVEMDGLPAFGAAVRNSASENLADNTQYPITFDTDDYDPWGFHDPAVNPERLTIPVAGTYTVRSQVYWGGNGANLRIHQIIRNGSEQLATFRSPPPGASEFISSVEWTGNLDLGDIVTCELLQNSGSAITVYPDQGSLRATIWRLAAS